jgi:flavin-dependent dehydrogenase
VEQTFTSPRSWDAVIVGASFAGLAAAVELAGAGRVLLVDRDPVGEGQTSACAAPLNMLEGLGLAGAVEQVHDYGVLHAPNGRAYRFRMRHRFATFDYGLLCRLLFARSGAEFLLATASGLTGPDTVSTSHGEHRAPVLIDASGWRAVLAARPQPGASSRTTARSVGIELRLPGGGDGLHFWLHHQAMADGYAWDFPAGDHRRVGILTYGASGGLRQRLEQFLGDSVGTRSLHGGSLPARLPTGVAGDRVFLVGDSAGQCLPLSGEGIRPALLYGLLAGRRVRQVLRGELSLESALAAYAQAVDRTRSTYALLSLVQRGVKRASRRSALPLAWLCGVSPLAWPAEAAYWRIARPELVSSLVSPVRI